MVVLVWHRLRRTGVELSSIPGFFNEKDSYAMKLSIIRPGGMALRNAMGVVGYVDSVQNGWNRSVSPNQGRRCPSDGPGIHVFSPDLAQAFPSAETVHVALRSLVSLAQRAARKPARKR